MTSSRTNIGLKTLEDLDTAFEQLTPKPKTQFSNREVVANLAERIRYARDILGYSLADIAEILQKHGVNIRPNTLRGYLSDLEKTTERAKKTKPATRSSPTKRANPDALATPQPASSPSRIEIVDLPDEDDTPRVPPVGHG